ncbi:MULTISPECIES: S53 family peptidase [Legionella]|uniref:S53 family peptidase n=1 Tax=Legionella TaxID=445 RepID=UPI00095AE791|nr:MULTISPECIES: S53 family peptidase [Legionella]MBN9227882.1 S8/S53 family peptidase [Legionella steelei]OJW16035.1 MAG: hypothetical protein BGO44_05980 [Legionella sp. 39-23]
MFVMRLIVCLFSLMIFLSTVWAGAEIKQSNFYNIELPILKNAKLLGPMNPQQEITFTIWLKLRNKEKLNHFIDELYDPQSFYYQKFLTKEEYDANYAPSERGVKEVENYFIAHGMKTKKVFTTIQVTAKASEIEKVLQIKLNNYLYKNKLFYGNVSKPKINSEIAQYISGISDLSNIPNGHPKIHLESSKKFKTLKESQANKHVEILNFAWDTFSPTAIPTTTSLQGFTGYQMRAAYNISSIAPVNGVTIDGTGQTIIIIDGCGTQGSAGIMDDVNTYNIANSLPQLSASNFDVVDYHGNPYTLGSLTCGSASSWDGEIALDIEASHTMAPGANIVLVMTNDVNNAQVATAINTLINNQFTLGGFTNAYVVSNSWGSAYDLQNEPLDATLQVATGMGASINFAAGDCGDQTYHSSWPCAKIGNDPSIGFPASSAYVTSVGGSSLFVDSNYNYAFESGWGTYKNGKLYSGSMGGVSKWRSFPSWQAPISNFTAGGYGIVGSTNRAIPDIAMVADYYTGLLIFQGGAFYKTGGASQSTPLFSGVVTLVNQARAILNGGAQRPIGLVAPYFYTFNSLLTNSKALNLITPPHQIISGATPVNNAPAGSIPPVSAFNISVNTDVITFNWDGVLSIIESQFWNDVVGVGSPNPPNFVSVMARL